ncbi:hypothetical protein Syun_019212 [Stephania yunnanensis]|uniref:Uncharacterized protein n=1 Tax=Stephania yunnanensis TaxID=152371 RepID=A0AAP0IUE2_9MAGN
MVGTALGLGLAKCARSRFARFVRSRFKRDRAVFLLLLVSLSLPPPLLSASPSRASHSLCLSASHSRLTFSVSPRLSPCLSLSLPLRVSLAAVLALSLLSHPLSLLAAWLLLYLFRPPTPPRHPRRGFSDHETLALLIINDPTLCSITAATAKSANQNWKTTHKFSARNAAAAKQAPNSISQNPSSISPSPHQDPSFPTILRRAAPPASSLKMHVGRPKSAVATRHSSAAEEALEQAPDLDPNANAALICVLRSFQGKLSGSNDYNYLLREFGNRDDCSKAVCCDRDRPASGV